jgi:PTS system nitrogen regulatory IIA component
MSRLIGLVARLERPIDFEAIDGQPVTSCSSSSPPRAPAPTISRPSRGSPRALRQPGLVERARAARDGAALYAVLTQSSAPQAA